MPTTIPTPQPSAMRSRVKKIAGGTLLGIAALVAGACSKSEALTGPAGNATPKVLRLAYTVSEETVELRVRSYGELSRYLSDGLGLRVELVETQGYGTTIEALRAGKIDICSSSPMPYLVAQSKIDVVPLVVPSMPDGSPSSYHSMFITSPATGLRSLDDVKARAASLTLAFADPASTSGHLIPRARLEEIGLNPDTDFKQVVFAMNHTASVMTVKSGKIDVAAITKTLYDRMLQDGRLQADELVVLWTSPPLHQNVIYTRASLPVALRENLIRLYVDLARERPDIWSGLRTRSTSGAVGYMPADDAMFDDFRRMARGLEHIKLLD